MRHLDERIYESRETLDAAFAAITEQAAAKWGHGNFSVTINPVPSKDLTTGQKLLYTGVAKRIVNDSDEGEDQGSQPETENSD